jgi:hypothetical protein
LVACLLSLKPIFTRWTPNVASGTALRIAADPLSAFCAGMFQTGRKAWSGKQSSPVVDTGFTTNQNRLSMPGDRIRWCTARAWVTQPCASQRQNISAPRIHSSAA